MNFDILTILYFIVGFSLLLLVGNVGAVISQLMGIRIQRPHLIIKDRSELPEYLNEVFASGIKRLEALGFVYHHCQYSLDILCHQRNDKWSLVYINGESNSYAEISPASSFLDLPGYEIDFWSIARDGSALITMNGRGHTVLCGISNADIHDPMAITLAEVYQSHIDERDDVFGKKPLIAISSENYVKVQQKLFDGYFLNLMNERAVISTGHNEFRLAFTKARRLLPQVLRGQKRLRKLLHDKLVLQESQSNTPNADEQISLSGTNFSVEAEVQSYLRMRSVQERTPGGITARLVLFFLVLSLTYLAFNLSFSLYSIIILVAVMTFHELGHIASMMLFGFRNYQVLFFPVFIDTTIKEKTSPDIWKQSIVYLMGPIPGIVIGLILLGLSQEYAISWLYEAAIILLVINYLNLLPIAPLDGGHLIRLTVMERFPSGKLILAGMSAIAFAAGGWYLGEPVFWVLALILFSTLPWSALEAGVLSELFQPTNDFEKLDHTKRLRCLFETFRQSRFDKLQYLQKFNLIKGLSDTLLLPQHLGRLGALGLNAIYLGALILTPPAAIITLIGMDNTVDMVAKIQGKPLEKNWDTIINNTDDPVEKFNTTLKAARFYISTNNFNKAQYYLDLAEKVLALIFSEEHLSNLYQTYSYYYLSKQELNTAEEYQQKVINLLDQDPENNAFGLATSYQNLAAIHETQNPTLALLDLKTSMSYALTINSPEERYVIISVINQLLNYYYDATDYTNARTILLDALSILSRHGDVPSRYVSSFIYQELGWLNLITDDLNKSIKQFKKALVLADENVIRIVDISQYGYDPFTKVNILLAMAVVQKKAGNTNSAKQYLEQAENELESNYRESLPRYIESNIPDAGNTADKLTTDVQTEERSVQKNNRSVLRWQMIATLLGDENVNTRQLELPEVSSSKDSNQDIIGNAEKGSIVIKNTQPEKENTLTENQSSNVIQKNTVTPRDENEPPDSVKIESVTIESSSIESPVTESKNPVPEATSPKVIQQELDSADSAPLTLTAPETAEQTE